MRKYMGTGHFPEKEEEQQIKRNEYAQDAGFEQEEEDHESFDLLLIVKEVKSPGASKAWSIKPCSEKSRLMPRCSEERIASNQGRFISN
jgi:hypothetical protein